MGGIHAFTGNSGEWVISQMTWERPLFSYPGLDSVLIRFNFISTDNISDKDGWMIDMFDFDLDDLCVIDVPEIETEETGIKLYPNPIEDISIIELPLIENQNYTIQIHSINGKLINEFNDICDNYLYINRKDYQSGLYIFKIYTKNQIITTQKFIVR